MATKRRRGRPPLEHHERRDADLHIRFKAEERDELDGAAERAGLTLSEWVRQVVLRAARRSQGR